MDRMGRLFAALRVSLVATAVCLFAEASLAARVQSATELPVVPFCEPEIP